MYFQTTYTMKPDNIIIVSKRAKAQQKKWADTHLVIDVTSTSEDATFRKFSPFYAHKPGIPVPGMSGVLSLSVEGIWQGLKEFEREVIDTSKFRVSNMKGLKRPANDKRGGVRGHRLGDDTMNYVTARKEIYLPSYAYKLEHYMQDELALLQGLLDEGNKLMLLDYETNTDVNDTRKPLSHAQLVKEALIARHQDR